MMRLVLRFIIPVAVVFCLIAFAIVPFVDALTRRWFLRDIDIRSQLVASALEDSVARDLHASPSQALSDLLRRVVKDERLYALGFCDSAGNLVAKTQPFPREVTCAADLGTAEVLEIPQGSIHVASHPISDSAGLKAGNLLVIHDMSFIERRTSDTRLYVLCLFAALGAVISFMTALIAQWSWKGWIRGMQGLLRGDSFRRPKVHDTHPELRPIVKDLRGLIRDLESERKARDASQVSWKPQTLKQILNRDLAGDEVLIVSNREPYIHVHRGEKIEVQLPASGLVTALEPIMRACSGTWIAHGAGDADREMVDEHDHVRVPPDDPSYRIRRVWLTPEEEKGYYYGFSNEGLWALCHIAHVRPTFRSQDWDTYHAVNRKFAEAVIEEAKTRDPVILVQDYHFALVPKMIREKLPRATVITFWHIPFPNPEVFGICPWREEILDGMLGSSILGFHTRFHCQNFLDSVDRFLESRIDRETSTVSYGGSLTAVNSYPISIEYPLRRTPGEKTVRECREHIRQLNGLPKDVLLGIGVDRLDYTKGILERFRAVERLLELDSAWVGKFTFIQIAAPSRSSIEQYQRFDSDVRALAEQINRRFGNENYLPILLKVEHHEAPRIYEYYRAADVCFVSSLHDGMNLVAKEYIAARDDEHGTLILSQFTGAARELPEALIVNPYDIDQCANALKIALEMPEREQHDRMRSMRGLIQEFNVYRWAGRMLLDAARMRQRSRVLRRSSFGGAKEQNSR